MPYPLEEFHDRLRDLCPDDGGNAGDDRREASAHQAEQACALARGLGLLIERPNSWGSFRSSETKGLQFGTEHLVEMSEPRDRVAKITIPPGFGLTATVVERAAVNLRNDPTLPATHAFVELVKATPLEYLERWIAANDVFGDDVRLESVVQWQGGDVSFGISQPQYHGCPAPDREIDWYFKAAGWKLVGDPSSPAGHQLFYNYAFQVLAVDALPRNCFLNEDLLLPFDVILCRPDDRLEQFLKLYPGT